jgi:PAS domain S-box-containing protein
MLPEKKVQAPGYTGNGRRQSDAEKSLQKYKQLFENLASAVLVLELIYKDGKAVDARILDANRAYFRHTGIRREEIIGQRLKEIFPHYREEFFQRMVEVVENGTTYESDEYVPQFGRYLSMAAYRFDRKQYVVVFDDITEQVLASEYVYKSEQKFKDLFRNMVTGLTVNKIIRSGKGLAYRRRSSRMLILYLKRYRVSVQLNWSANGSPKLFPSATKELKSC